MMSIGELSTRVGLTVKTIRLYQEKGLLLPARVDSWTGYRYYDEASVARAHTIVRLRSFKFSLREIHELLEHYEDQSTLLEALQRQRDAIAHTIDRYNRVIALLDTTIAQNKENIMVHDMHALKKDVPEQIARWRSRSASPERANVGGSLHNITVSSAWGLAGGRTLAAALSKRIAFEVWDHDAIAAIALDHDTRAEIIDSLTEEQRAACDALVASSTTSNLPQEKLAELRVAAALALHGGAIILEMGGHRLLPPERALRVRLISPRNKTIAHHAARHNLHPETAQSELDAAGDALAAFVRDTFDHDLRDPEGYDLVLNSSTLNLFTAVELCVQAYEARFSPEPGWWYA